MDSVVQNLSKLIFESAQRLSAQLIGLPKAYEVDIDTYRVDFGNFIIETETFSSSKTGESLYTVRQIYPTAQVHPFIRVAALMAEAEIKTFA